MEKGLQHEGAPGWMLSLALVALLDRQEGIAELAAPHRAAAGAWGASPCTSFQGRCADGSELN